MEVIIITNKELIFKLVKDHTEKNNNFEKVGVTAEYVGKALNLKRDYTSRILNELHKDHKLIKIKTRPVLFIDKSFIEKKTGIRFSGEVTIGSLNKFLSTVQKNENQNSYGKVCTDFETNPFNKLIGFDGSLKYQVEQCKAAIRYPPNGLPILITGPTGSGKSFLAKLVQEYAVHKNIIEPGAPLVIFNCAEYADNPELLSAYLFGYAKGAFTGAEKDTKGALEEANGGFLFLDEVHRLSAEGQEKLFLFMDNNVFRRLGESKDFRKSSARLIFATTEKIEKFMVSTFLRRIPIIVEIPPFNKRPLYEKLILIYHFFKHEARSLNKDILLRTQALRTFIHYDFKGNVGQLRSDIRLSCATAYNRYCNLTVDSKFMEVTLLTLPEHLVKDATEPENAYNNSSINELLQKDLEILCDNAESFEIKNLVDEKEANVYICFYHDLLILLKNFQLNDKEYTDLNKLTVAIVEFFDRMTLRMNSFPREDWRFVKFTSVHSCLQESFKLINKRYDLKYYDNVIYKLACFISQSIDYSYLPMFNKNFSKFNKYIEYFKTDDPLFYKISDKISHILKAKLDIILNPLEFVVLCIYLKGIAKQKTKKRIKAVIIAHGLYTASSIANVANYLLGENVFEAFDMPIDVKTEEIIDRLRCYLAEVDTSMGVIILVDMGSLEVIYEGLNNVSKGVMGIVNNITTQLALDTGSYIQQGFPIEEIVKKVTASNRSRYKMIKPEGEKKKVLITTCITGIGTAVKIKDLIVQSLGEYSEKIEVMAYDFLDLKNKSESNQIFNNYHVIAIIGTKNPGIENMPFFSLEDIISGQKETEFSLILKGLIPTQDIEKISHSIVKYFSLENVLHHITILNPDKIINQVEMAVESLQYELNVRFTNEVNICLYLHLSCLIERLVTKTQIDDYNNNSLAEFAKSHTNFVKITKKCFSVIEKLYNVTIPITEIYFIYDILSAKMPDVLPNAR